MKKVQNCTDHRICLVLLIIAHKFLYDKTYRSITWLHAVPKNINMTLSELNRAERTMLDLLKWDLRPTDVEMADTWLLLRYI